MNTAAERLALSRARLRAALLEDAPAPAAPGMGSGTDWSATLRGIPGAGIVLDALGAWWAQHPLHAGAQVPAAAARTWAGPLARRHPLGLVAGAMLAGGVLAWSRPWRWVFKPALLAGLLPQLLLRTLTQQPLPAWLATLAGGRPARTGTSPTDAAPQRVHDS